MTVAGNPGIGLIYLLYFFIIFPFIIFLGFILPQKKKYFLRLNAVIGFILLLDFSGIILEKYELNIWNNLLSFFLYLMLCSGLNIIFTLLDFFINSIKLSKMWWVFNLFFIIGIYLLSIILFLFF